MKTKNAARNVMRAGLVREQAVHWDEDLDRRWSNMNRQRSDPIR